MDAVGATDSARCRRVGDRLFGDIWGASKDGMRTAQSRSRAIRSEHTEREPGVVAVAQRHCGVYDVVIGLG